MRDPAAAPTGVIRPFLGWWKAGLVDLLPLPLRRTLRPAPKRVAIEIEADQARIGVLSPPDRHLAVTHICALSGPETPPRTAARNWLRRRRSAAMSVRLPGVSCLSKILNLPLAAEENLRQVLAFEMDRHTPYGAADIYFGFRVLERAVATQRLHVMLSVVPRAAIDATLERIAALGVRPSVAELADQDGPAGGLRTLSLGTGEETPQRRTRSVDIFLIVLALVLLIGVLALPLLQKRSALAKLQAAAALAQGEATSTAKLREQLDQTTGALGRMIGRREATPLTVEIIDTLTQLLPDDTWLQSLELNGSKLTIQGQARTATRLIELLEASGRFNNPTFQAPVQVNPQTSTERFNIAVQVKSNNAS